MGKGHLYSTNPTRLGFRKGKQWGRANRQNKNRRGNKEYRKFEWQVLVLIQVWGPEFVYNTLWYFNIAIENCYL